MNKELGLFSIIFDYSNVLILLKIEKDLPGAAKVAPSVKIILMLNDR